MDDFLAALKRSGCLYQPFHLYGICSHAALSYKLSNHVGSDVPWCPESGETRFPSAQYPGRGENLSIPVNAVLALSKRQHLTVTDSL